MKIAFADDERHALERFKMLVKEHPTVELCGLFEDGESLLTFAEDHPLDVVFLDIEMPGQNGLAVAEALLAKKPNLVVVFVTAYNQYAVEAFELNAIDYLLKPVSAERFAKTIERLNRSVKQGAAAHGALYIRCFSGFECLKDGVPLLFSGGKTKELLAFLVGRCGASASWDQIADALWEDDDFERAHNNLHITVYRLRKWLSDNGISDILECRRNNYRLLTNQFGCDLYEFEKAFEEKDEKRMKQLYRGEYLEENGYSWALEKQAAIAMKMVRLIEETV